VYEDIERLLNLSKKGDTKAKEQLLSKLEPLILSSIRRYYYKPYMYEDLIQEGYEVVLDSIEEYDPDRKVYFLGFVKLRLKYHYLNKHKEKQTISLNQTIGDDGMELVDMLQYDGPDPLERAIQIEEIQALKKAINFLTPRQREVVVAYYVEGMALGEIAEKLGIAYRTVVNTKTMAIEKLKKTIVK
jgi:RNA polymerase sporulation-specific sigma factor